MVLQHESTLRRTSDDHPEHTGERDLPRYFSHVGQRLIGSSHLQDEVNSETWSLDYVGLASLENFYSADPTTNSRSWYDA